MKLASKIHYINALELTPDTLDRFFLGVSDRAGFTPSIGAVASGSFIRTRNHPGYRHLQMSVGIRFFYPI